jgi:methylglutaconyl-CoA hydratase
VTGAEKILLDVDARGVATVTLNRPEIGNAYDGDMLAALIDGLARLERDTAVRALVIRGAGKHFQAGADINWLGRASGFAPEEAFAASMATTRAMQLLNEFPKPTIAMVHGACFGGGCGIVCCVDIALATPDAQFGLTEVRIGVAPTPISTHMVHAMGVRHTRRYALTGERFPAGEALRIGLVHEVIPADAIEQRLAEVLDAVFLSAPGAIAVTKTSFLAANQVTLDAREMAMLAHESWTQRNSAEGREGTAAFREKRRPAWYVPPSTAN